MNYKINFVWIFHIPKSHFLWKHSRSPQEPWVSKSTSGLTTPVHLGVPRSAFRPPSGSTSTRTGCVDRWTTSTRLWNVVPILLFSLSPSFRTRWTEDSRRTSGGRFRFFKRSLWTDRDGGSSQLPLVSFDDKNQEYWFLICRVTETESLLKRRTVVLSGIVPFQEIYKDQWPFPDLTLSEGLWKEGIM